MLIATALIITLNNSVLDTVQFMAYVCSSYHTSKVCKRLRQSNCILVEVQRVSDIKTCIPAYGSRTISHGYLEEEQ